MREPLDEKDLHYLISQRKKGRAASEIAADLKITPRHERRLWERFRATKKVPVSRSPGRPKKSVAEQKIEAVLEAYREAPMGVQRMTCHLRSTHDISYHETYRIMKAEDLTELSSARPGQRKYLRFERKYSNAMWHVDWHIMKDPRLKGLNLVTYLDDASRCITGFGIFEHATGANSVMVLREGIGAFGAPSQILSDNGSQFTARRRRPRKRWQPTLFEEELMQRKIALINSRPHHPQTNGKLERFFRTLEKELPHFGHLTEFMAYYNERRLHYSLDMHNRQTPLKAFGDKRATNAIRKSNPKWMEVDTND